MHKYNMYKTKELFYLLLLFYLLFVFLRLGPELEVAVV